jgi:hypothetical protein
MFMKLILKAATGLSLLLVLLVTTGQLHAFNYGSGNYGDCVYGGELGNDAFTFSVNTSSVTLSPNVSPSSTAFGTATFSIELGCSDRGYVVAITGTAPTNGGYTLANLSSATASSAGTEQYGINLVDNATPNVGANPSGGSGAAASGYNTADQFKYVSGNTIASTATYSATTTYTVSFIANAAIDTPARTYSTTHTIICTATF